MNVVNKSNLSINTAFLKWPLISFFFFFQVYTVVDEMFLAGEIRETSQTKVLKQLLMLGSLE